MLAEFIDRIVKLAHGSKRGQFLTHDSLPNRVYLQNPDGDMDEIDVPPDHRRHKLEGFKDILLAINDEMSSAPEVFVDEDGVIVHLNRSLRRERVKLDLSTTEQFKKLCSMRTPMSFDPRQAIKMLRYDLHGAETDGIVQALSRVDFTRTSTGKSVVEHGNESLGRSVEAAVQQAETIPDRFTVNVPIWINPGFKHHTASIQCGVYLDLEMQKVEIGVLADEINRALVYATQAVVAEFTAQVSCPVFHGRP